MPNDLIQHRMNQYWQDICYTEKFMSQCRKKSTANRFVTVHDVLCRCPFDGQECLQIGNMKGCLENYDFLHFKSLGRKMPIMRTTFSDRYHDRHYYCSCCSCPPDPCAFKAFYNQCREYETKNMHGVDVAEAEVMFHPKSYPSNYSETAKLIRLPEISCFVSIEVCHKRKCRIFIFIFRAISVELFLIESSPSPDGERVNPFAQESYESLSSLSA